MIESLAPISVGSIQHWERITYLVLENRLKINEILQHINDLEQKLLSAEELLEAEDIKATDEALKKGKFVNFKDLPETFGKRVSDARD